MQSARSIPQRRNLAIAAALTGVQVFQLFVLPQLPYSRLWWVALPFLILLNLTLWATIHEAIHRLLHARKQVNDGLGRALSILFGVSFDVVKFAHLMHHRFNRDWESEYYDPAKKSYSSAALEYYGVLFGGLYVLEVLTSLACLLPAQTVNKLLWHHAATRRAHLHELVNISHNYFFIRGHHKDARIDTLAVIAVYAVSFALYGAHWPWLLALIGGRAFAVSFMDNIYHYATPMDNSVPAMNVSMPAVASLFILRMNLHYTHHNRSNVAWTGLSEARNVSGTGFHQSIWRAGLDQFKGPIPLTDTVMAQVA